MVFSRGAVLDRVDGASTAYEEGIEYDASAMTCARARGAEAESKQVLQQLEIKTFYAVDQKARRHRARSRSRT